MNEDAVCAGLAVLDLLIATKRQQLMIEQLQRELAELKRKCGAEPADAKEERNGPTG